MVKGPTFEGVIFTPEILPRVSADDPEPLVAAGVWPRKGSYWTPSLDLIKKVELAFAKEVTEANSNIPPGGFHFREFYTPKYGSRDRGPGLPDDIYTNFIYNWNPAELPHIRRQYIGVTVDGKKMLVMNMVYNDQDIDPGDQFEGAMFKDWKNQWMYIEDAGVQIIYDFDTGKFSEIDT